MAVITISRQFGSGGDEIADRLCQTLGYSHFDKRLISRAAQEAGLSDQEIIDYSEENYKVKNFMDRLFSRSRPVGQVRIWKEDPSGVRVTEEIQLSEDYALALVQKAVKAAYQVGDVVIIGRGGQVVLKDQPDVLHIRVEAPMEERIQRVKSQLKYERNLPLDVIDTRRKAQNLIEERDAASAQYLKHFYSVDWDDPLLYHLVVNAGKIHQDLAVQTICELARSLKEVHVIV
jgi:cytidylate kinase